MGNQLTVMAADAAPPLAPPPPSPRSEEVQIQPTEDKSIHPGGFEDLHKKTKEIFPQLYEGGKFVVQKGLSSHFQISHNFTMSSTMPAGYKFGATFVGNKKITETEVFPVMMGEFSLSGDMLANVIHQWTDIIRSRTVVQVMKNDWVAQQGQLDFKGKDFTATVGIVNPDLFGGNGLMMAHYLQNVTERLSLGAEFVYQRGSKIPGGHVGILSVGGRYIGNDWQFAASFTPDALTGHMSYYHKILENFKVGAEIEVSGRMGEAATTVGYEYELQPANLTFRAQADTNWNVGAVFEKRLAPLPFTLSLCGMINHVKPTYNFGIGLIMG